LQVDGDRLANLPPVQPQQPAQQQPAAQADQFAPQPEFQPAQQAPGADPELEKLFRENPKIRGGVQAALTQIDVARQQYAEATQQALQQAAVASIAAIPELQGLSAEAARGALGVIQKNNPARFAEIAAHLTRIEQVRQAMHQQAQAHQQAHAAQQQQAQQQTQNWMNEQDVQFDNWAKSRPAGEWKQVRENVADVLQREYGIDRAELGQMWNTSPLLRSLPVQKLLYDLTRFHLAKDSIHRAPMPNRPVMRPGTVDTSGADYSELAARMKDFAGNPTAKAGAAALIARRRAASRQR